MHGLGEAQGHEQGRGRLFQIDVGVDHNLDVAPIYFAVGIQRAGRGQIDGSPPGGIMDGSASARDKHDPQQGPKAQGKRHDNTSGKFRFPKVLQKGSQVASEADCRGGCQDAAGVSMREA